MVLRASYGTLKMLPGLGLTSSHTSWGPRGGTRGPKEAGDANGTMVHGNEQRRHQGGLGERRKSDANNRSLALAVLEEVYEQRLAMAKLKNPSACWASGQNSRSTCRSESWAPTPNHPAFRRGKDGATRGLCGDIPLLRPTFQTISSGRSADGFL